MSKGRISVAGAILGAASVLGGALGIIAVMVRFLPVLDDVRHIKEAVDIYADYVREPVQRFFGAPFGTNDGTAGFIVDVLIFWIAFFIAVNAFTLKREGWLLPTHIKNNHCQLRRSGLWSSLACVTPKLLVAFLAAPVVCVGYAFTKFSAPGDRLYSAGYITIQPREVLHYLLLMIGTVAVLLLLTQQLAEIT